MEKRRKEADEMATKQRKAHIKEKARGSEKKIQRVALEREE